MRYESPQEIGGLPWNVYTCRLEYTSRANRYRDDDKRMRGTLHARCLKTRREAVEEGLRTLQRLRKQAEIRRRARGAHLFRHTLACDLLHQGCSLDDIGELLRRQSPDTTADYAKVEVTASVESAR